MTTDRDLMVAAGYDATAVDAALEEIGRAIAECDRAIDEMHRRRCRCWNPAAPGHQIDCPAGRPR